MTALNWWNESMGTLRWRRFSPIDRDVPIFELVEGELIILDVSKDDEGALEVGFHEGAVGRVLDLALLEGLLEEVKVLLAEDEAG